MGLLLGMASFAASGCFKPSIADGGYLCGIGDSCPEGFSCFSNRCYRSAPDAAPVDQGNPDTCVPRQALAGCTLQSELICDPVCQTGCCTNQKCTALNTGTGGIAALGCSPLTSVHLLGEPCDATNAGTPQRSDNCLAGLVCIDGNVGGTCLKLCRVDADCDTGTTCERRRVESSQPLFASVCGLPNTICNPTGTATLGCPANRVCYLEGTSASGDRTVCDISSGGGLINSSCTYSRDCIPGATCPKVGPGVSRCEVVCAHNGAPANCPSGTSCQMFGSTYDYCI